MNLWKMMIGALVALGFAATGASAAPLSGLAGPKADPANASAVERTYWVSKCHYKHGHRYCHRVWVAPKRVYRHYNRPYVNHFYHRPHRYHHYRGHHRGHRRHH